jgi:hypothetical protein
METFFGSKYTERKFLVLVSTMMIVLIVDVSLSNVSDIIARDLVSTTGIILFIILSCIYSIVQYFILKSVIKKNMEAKRHMFDVHLINRAMVIVQSILTAIIFFGILQIIFASGYYTSLLIASTTISYGFAAVVMGILSYRLLSWFKLNRSIIVLLYGLASIFITVNAVSTIIFFDFVLLGKQAVTTPTSEVVFAPSYPVGTPMGVVTTMQIYSNILYFALMWLSTAVVLRYNINRVGKIKFYILVSLPLIYFLSYYFTLYSTINPSSPEPAPSSLFFLILMFGYAYVMGGFLIALAFRALAKAVSKSNIVKYYMLLTAYGFVLFFTAASATILQAPYPPYGLVNVSVVSLSLFLILSGLHYSAVSLAQDVNLRNSIKRSAIKEFKVLDSIGTAQMQQEVEKKVLTTVKHNLDTLTKDSGINPSLSEDEIKYYMEEALNELKKTRPKDTTN